MKQVLGISIALVLGLEGCLVGEDAGQGPPRNTAAATAGNQLFGIHDPGGESLMGNAGRRGWVVYSESVRDVKFHAYNEGYGAIVRLNWGYDTDGTLPCDAQLADGRHAYDDFAQKAAAFVTASSGASIWVIANEANIGAEWPLCDNARQPITPERYVRAFKLARKAIHDQPGHGGDQVVMLGVGVYNVQIGINWIQYYEAILNGLGAGGADGIALHAYTRSSNPAEINTDVIHSDDHRQWGFRAYRDFLAATPQWARRLPVYITETDQNGKWSSTETNWVPTLYDEIRTWNSGPDSGAHQKIQAVALYRWSSPPPNGVPPDGFALYNQPTVQRSFTTAMATDSPSPAPSQPSESRTNDCSTEALGNAPFTPPETGFTISGWIQRYWNEHGNVPIFGYPLGNAHRLINSSGDYVCSQLFQRHRIELQLNADGSLKMAGNYAFVTLGRVGAERLLRDADLINGRRLGYGESGGNTADCQSFMEVPYKICGALKQYWNTQGGLGLFGFPQSDLFTYRTDDGREYTSQYFERARFERHPEDGTIKGGLLGDELNRGVRD